MKTAFQPPAAPKWSRMLAAPLRQVRMFQNGNYFQHSQLAIGFDFWHGRSRLDPHSVQNMRSFDFASLTYAERLQMMQDLLDSLYEEASTFASADQADATFTPEQMEELRRRAAGADAGCTIAEPWETVRARLQTR